MKNSNPKNNNKDKKKFQTIKNNQKHKYNKKKIPWSKIIIYILIFILLFLPLIIAIIQLKEI
ncbi:hypothetical protein MDPP_0073 [Candidatus Phytoplasma pini]|uniref:Uncharacterized protein n=1 Tax=Candidatus Phytoplasma pini TaxID=267362 RepID=A0A559KK20_9MOLU|nr:hypothetical protein MDPP_0073 [Candidatus Phytoplasma pini]